MSRHLLIVSTRGYAERGGADDEYCTQWGFNSDEDYRWILEQNGVALLVLHGFRGFDPANVIHNAANSIARNSKKEMKVSDVSFYYHSIGGFGKVDATKDQENEEAIYRIEKAENAIKENYGITPKPSQPYHSRSGLAVEELKKDIWESTLLKGKAPQLLISTIEMAAAGRPLFVNKLRVIQSILIRIRLLFEVVHIEATKSANGMLLSAFEKQMMEAGKDLKINMEGARGRFRQWLDAISGKVRPGESNNTFESFGPHETEAADIIRFFSGMTDSKSSPQTIHVPEAWAAIKRSPKSMFLHAKTHLNELNEDICLLSRAVDILVLASEQLPSSLLVISDDYDVGAKDDPA